MISQPSLCHTFSKLRLFFLPLCPCWVNGLAYFTIGNDCLNLSPGNCTTCLLYKIKCAFNARMTRDMEDLCDIVCVGCTDTSSAHMTFSLRGGSGSSQPALWHARLSVCLVVDRKYERNRYLKAAFLDQRQNYPNSPSNKHLACRLSLKSAFPQDAIRDSAMHC